MRRAGGRVPRWVRIIAYVIVGTFLLYLIAANVILRTHLLRGWLSKDAENLRVEYSSAWSGYPGHLAVRDLSLRYQDSNVQMVIQLERADLRIDPWALTKRMIRFSKVEGIGASYFMRHKMESAEGLEGRWRAFPPIDGYSDPPLWEGPAKPDIPDDQYKLWTIELANVSASLREVWIMEYRYRGEGSLTGGFHLKPKRMVWVMPSVMVTHGGLYSLGDRELIRGGEARLEARVDPFDPRVPEGPEVLRQMTFQMHQDGELVSLDSIGKTYVPPDSKLVLAEGSGPIAVDIRVDNGVIHPSSRVSYHSNRAVVKAPPLTSEGEIDLGAHLGEAAGTEPPGVLIEMSSEHTTLTPSAALRGIKASLLTTNSDLAKPLALARVFGSVTSVHVANLHAWQPVAPENITFDGGAATFAARADYHGGGALEGRLDATLDKTRMTIGTFGFVCSGKAKTNVVSEDIARAVAFPDTEVDLRDIGMKLQSGHEEGMWMRARFVKAKLTTSGAVGADTDIAVASGPGDRTVKLFTRMASLPDVAADATSGTELAASLHLRVRPNDIVLDIHGAKNGALQSRGRVRKKKDAAMSGALLVSVGPLYLGLDMHDGGVSVVPVAGGHWLDEKLRER